jgi:hypothetical protein
MFLSTERSELCIFITGDPANLRNRQVRTCWRQGVGVF